MGQNNNLVSVSDFKETVDKVVTYISDKATNLQPQYVTYGVQIDTTNSDPGKACTYIGDCENHATGWDAWKDDVLFSTIRPCILNNGQVLYYLQRDNMTLKEDGSTANFTSIGLDTMIEFPKIGYKFETVGDKHNIYITNDPDKEGFCYLAHSLNNIGDCDKIYIGAYLGYVTSNQLYSLAEYQPTASTTLTNFRTYATNRGSGYQLLSFYPWTLLQCLYLIIYKNLNGQGALGQGYVGGSAEQKNGLTKINTFCYGTMSATQCMKFLGVENMWGNLYQWCDGLYCDNNRNILTYYKNFTATDNGDTGYYASTASGYTANFGSYTTNIQGTNDTGFIPKGAITGASGTTYYCDYSFVVANRCAAVGSYYSNGDYVGPFCYYIGSSVNQTNVYFGARLIYKHKTKNEFLTPAPS